MFFDGKAGDRLAVFAMPSTTRPVQDGSIPMTTQAATLGFDPVPDERAEEQLEILTELQPAVGMGERQRALDVVCDRLARGIRRSSSGRMTTWLRTPTRPFSRRPIEIAASHITTFWS